MASLSSEERVILQDKIKAQGEVVRKLKAAKEETDEAKQQVFDLPPQKWKMLFYVQICDF